MCTGLRRWARRSCTLSQLRRRVPICEWAPRYDREKAVSDLVAGVTVGLTVIPQGIAYANIAELEPKVRGDELCSLLACYATVIVRDLNESQEEILRSANCLTFLFAKAKKEPFFLVC